MLSLIRMECLPTVISVFKRFRRQFAEATCFVLEAAFPLYFLLLFIATPGFSQPQISQIKHFGKAEGLTSPRIYAILPNEDGLFWLLAQELDTYFFEEATQIVRFDGRSFRTLYDTPDPELFIHQLTLLDSNSLVINYKMPFFDILNTQSGQFERKEIGPSGLEELNMRSELFGEGQQSFIVQTPEKVLLVNWQNGLDTLWSFAYQEGEEDAWGVFQHDDVIWFSHTSIGMAKYQQDDGQVKYYPASAFESLDTSIEQARSITFREAVSRPNGEIVFAMRDLSPGYFRYRPERDRFEPVQGIPKTLESYAPYRDEAGRVLLAFGTESADEALWLMDLDDQLVDYSHLLPPATPLGLCFFSKDLTNHLWVGTTKGLTYIKLQPQKKKIKKLLQPYSMRNAIELTPGKTLFATELNGWFLWEEARDTIEPFPVYQNGEKQSTNYCRGFYLDDQGTLWATNYEGLLKVNWQTQQCAFYKSDSLIQAFLQLKNGHFLLEGEKHPTLLEFNPATETFTDYMPAIDGFSLVGKFCHALHEAANGIIWAGTDVGLIKFDKKAKQIEVYSKKDGFRSRAILSIHEEPDGKLWLGTGDAGVHIFDPETEQLAYIQEKDGLTNKTVAGILKDVEGDLWFSTFNGISCYKIEEKTFLNYSEVDGFSHFEFNRHSFYQKPDGRLCFGTIQGMNVFDPRELKGNPTFPKLLLLEAQFYDKATGGQSVRHYNLSQLNEINLPPNNRYLRLRFALSELEDAALHKFAYFLEGYDEGWNALDTRNEVLFNKLPVGNYTLHIRGISAKGEWNVNPATIDIQIAQYFYKTWWFISLCLLTFVGAVYALYRYRLNQVYRMLELRTRIASDLHDDVGGLLTGIAMQTEILELAKGPPEKSKLQNLRELSKNALSRMRDVVWSIDARRDKIGDLLDRMREQAEEMLAAKGIQYKITTHNLNEEKVLPIDIRQHLYLIFKEALSNAVRHAQATRVEVNLGNNGAAFEMRIRDNGIGLDEAKKATGLGLDNMKRRAAKMKAVIEFTNRKGFEILVRREAI